MAKIRTTLNTRDPWAGYAAFSIVLHWLTAIGVIVLFLTHDDFKDFHVALGLLLTPVFLFRIGWRLARGYPRVANQPAALNLLARLIQLGFILSILAVTVTGLLLPLLNGETYSFFGFGEFSMAGVSGGDFADALEEIHDFSGHAFVPLLALHAAGALKHHFFDRDAVLMRMIRPVQRGK